MKIIPLLTIATAAAILVGGSTHKTLAAENGAAPPAQARILQRIAKKLNLTDEQKSQIKAVLGADRGTLAALLGQLHDARKNLRASIHAGDANETSVRAEAAKVGSAEAEFAVERMKLYGKIAPILTDEQRRQIAAIEERFDRFADGAIARIGDGADN